MAVNKKHLAAVQKKYPTRRMHRDCPPSPEITKTDKAICYGLGCAIIRVPSGRKYP